MNTHVVITTVNAAKRGGNSAMTLQDKWEARLSAEGMPREPRLSNKQFVTGEYNPTMSVDESPADYWTALTHVVHSLNGAFGDTDKRFLRAYVESGYLAKAARETSITERRARTAIARLHRWIKNKQEPRRKEYGR